MILGLTHIDLLVILVYFGAIIIIGVRASFKIKNQEDFLLGGRKFGKLISTFASFGQATSADGPAGVATTTFNNGASGIWSSLLMLFVTPLFWITSPWLRRLRILTMGDFYLERYGSRWMAAVYALIASIGMMGLLSVGYMAVTKTALAMTSKPVHELTAEQKQERNDAIALLALEKVPASELSPDEKEKLDRLRVIQPNSLFSYLNESILIWGICFLVIVYTILGGLEAAFYTDLLQGVFIIILSIILIPFAWYQISSLYGGTGILDAPRIIHDRLPENIFEVFGSPLAIDFTWYFILTVAVVSGLTVVTQPNQLVTAGAAKDEFSARVGFVTGTFMKRVITIMWGVLGIAAILLYSTEIKNSDLVWGHATRELLGPLNLGLVGLMLASMMAALMSTADCLMITVSGLMVNNLYKPFLKVSDEGKLLWAGRIFGALFLIGGAIITTQFDNILQVLKFIWEFFVIFAAAFWLGLKWRKANRTGAWISIAGSFLVFYFIPVIIPVLFPSARTNEALLKRTDPAPVVRNYTAKIRDVELRHAEIEAFTLIEDSTQIAPLPLKVGQEYKKTYQLPRKAIIWSKGIKADKDGNLTGSGYIYLELLLLDWIGFDLSQNAYALNETIRMSIRLVVPFLLLVFGSLAFSVSQDELTKRFFTKMRLPVSEKGPQDDLQRLSKAYEDPSFTTRALIFPTSDWEFYRWNKKDWIGFLISWGMVFLVLLLLYLAVGMGA